MSSLIVIAAFQNFNVVKYFADKSSKKAFQGGVINFRKAGQGA
jgi:hypothetical protein